MYLGFVPFAFILFGDHKAFWSYKLIFSTTVVKFWPLFFSHICICICAYIWASQVVLVIKNLPANVGDKRDMGSLPGSGRSPGGGNGNPSRYSCLENPVDRGAWWATVHGVT